MVLEKLGNSLKSVFSRITGAIFLDKKTVEAVILELRRALLEADVDLKLVNELADKVRALALDEKLKGVERKEQIITLIHDELVTVLGKEKHELEIRKPAKIFLAGLYGAGKTTTIAKLAMYYGKRGFRVCLLGLDTQRPAATDQLEQLGKKVNVPVFVNKQEKNPLAIYNEYESQIAKYDVCFIDTAGRDALNAELIKEIKNLYQAIKPQHVILVMPADIGQAARRQAEEFKNSCAISGVIITRMDGTAKAGGALVACSETNSPVLFIGTGEHIADIEVFSPTAFVSRILGMGDLEALLEKVKTASDLKDAPREHEQFTLKDFYEQIKAMQNLGPLNKITSLLPLGGMKIPSEMMNVQEGKIKKWKSAIDSMTQAEIENPEVLEKQTTRLPRIAKGAGVSVSDVKELLMQYRLGRDLLSKSKNFKGIESGNLNMADLQKQMRQMGLSQKDLMKLAKRFKGMR